MTDPSTTEKSNKTLPMVLWIVPALILIVAVFPLPYGYYTFTRIVTCLACIVLAYSTYRSTPPAFGWCAAFAIVAVLFNPIIPIHLTRGVWMGLDLGAAAIILAHFALARGISSRQP
jgi:hypothetical protein